MSGCRKRIPRRFDTQVASVKKWLSDIRDYSEGECVLMEVKTVGCPVEARNEAARVKDDVYKIQAIADCLYRDLFTVFQKIKENEYASLLPAIFVLRDQSVSCLNDCHDICPEMDVLSKRHELMSQMTKILTVVEQPELVRGNVKMELTSAVTKFGKMLQALVKSAQSSLVKKLITMVEDSASEISLKFSVMAVYTLAQDGVWLRRLLLQQGAMGALLEVCRIPSCTIHSIATTALQAIRMLRTEAEGREELEKAGGVGILVEMIGSPATSDVTLYEALSVLAELTSPDVAKYPCMFVLIEHMEDLLKHLTTLCDQTYNTPLFNVAVSVMANITFMDTMSSDYLVEFDAGKVLIQGFIKGKSPSLYSQHQVLTVIANMCGRKTCHRQILEAGGMEFLSTLLHMRPPKSSAKRGRRDTDRNASWAILNGSLGSPSLSEVSPGSASMSDVSPGVSLGASPIAGSQGSPGLAALEPGPEFASAVTVSHSDLHQKVAIAVGRLCHDYDTCLAAVQLNMIPRLVELCRDHRETNEAVILACLAALRKIHSHVGAGIFLERDMEELITPSLMQSFTTCQSDCIRETLV